MNILGVSAFYHDSAAAIVVDGNIVAAAQEERFTREKHDARFPKHAIEYCVREAGTSLADIDLIAFYDKPFLKFERLLETYVAFAPRGFESFRAAMPIWLKEKLFQKRLLIQQFEKLGAEKDIGGKLLFSEHHFSHAASAFYPSPFEEAVVLTLDGVGEWATTAVAVGRGNNLTILKELHFPHSLGLLYSAFTQYLGFKVNSGEYKVMGLAPYGEPRFKDAILHTLMDLKADGTFRLDLSYFDYCTGLRMINDGFGALFGAQARNPETELLTQFHMDMAASVQAVTDEVVLRLTRSLSDEYRLPNLCLAGGVALNCVTNGKVLRDGSFERIWIQPAAGDAGGAVGSALAAWHSELDKPRSAGRDRMEGAYLGPKFSNEEVCCRLREAGAVFEMVGGDEAVGCAAEALAGGKAVGWFQGRMEFGPRALGNRSILGDPRSPSMQKLLNLKVKFRESFRPFAPSVLREDASYWFDLDCESPYMLLVADIHKQHRRAMSPEESSLFGIDKLNVARSSLPAVTHVDYSARVQTVTRETNPRYHALLSLFKERSGCGVLVNTSFNVRGEPIVCTPEDAFRCFMGSDIEMLVIEDCVLRKELQHKARTPDYAQAFELD